MNYSLCHYKEIMSTKQHLTNRFRIKNIVSKDKKGCKRLALAEHTAHHLTPRYIQLVCPLTAGRLLPNQLLFSLGRCLTNGNLCSLRQWGKGFFGGVSSRCSFASCICIPLIPAHVICGHGTCCSFERKIMGRDKIDH